MDKQNIHIIGSGWASIGFLKHIDTNKYNVTVISDNLKFCYTPLLAYNCTNNINLEEDILLNSIIPSDRLPIHENTNFLPDGSASDNSFTNALPTFP